MKCHYIVVNGIRKNKYKIRTYNEFERITPFDKLKYYPSIAHFKFSNYFFLDEIIRCSYRYFR